MPFTSGGVAQAAVEQGTENAEEEPMNETAEEKTEEASGD
jgi:hypothetical protein